MRNFSADNYSNFSSVLSYPINPIEIIIFFLIGNIMNDWVKIAVFYMHKTNC